ncbi:MAG: hypothetical protein Solumvirus1_13 [Solumvirus sp.]|uniref:Transcription factor TFIID n=1 Tax=Solumvirus sp. TaxID=2487773 RepID=A0A3G5AG89_9VIRU|nr:MAG: hypothetical protein Solumvirus1_13 [Solumvirus sp.]
MEIRENQNNPSEAVVEIKSFKDLSATTMTCGVGLTDSSINLNTILWLLPITKVPPLTTKKKKNRIPFLADKPNSFISIRYKNYVRGLQRSESKTAFSHSITIDLCTKIKSLNIKLAPESMHICGATSKEVAIEGAQCIIDALVRIQNILEFIRANKRVSYVIAEYIKHLCKGEKVSRDTSVNNSKGGVPGSPASPASQPRINIIIRTQDHNIKSVNMTREEFQVGFTTFREIYEKENKNKYLLLPGLDTQMMSLSKVKNDKDDVKSEIKSEIKGDVKSDVKSTQSNDIGKDNKTDSMKTISDEYVIAKYFMDSMDEFEYYSDYTKKLMWILKVCDYHTDKENDRMCCNKDMKINGFHEYMTNYNFPLNLHVNRWNLAKLFKQRDGFFSRFDNTIHHGVTIELPVNIDIATASKNKTKKKRKNDITCWRWLIYKSGKVTMSTPTSIGAEEAYTKLMSIIAENIDDIRVAE